MIISNKHVAIFLIIITACYTASVFPNLLTHDEYPDYYLWMKPYLDKCQVGTIPQFTNGTDIENLRNPVKWQLNCLSHKIGYDNLIPGIIGISILPMTYLVAVSLTRNKMISMGAVVGVLINPLYHDWSVSGVYDQSWALFLLVSIYLIFKLPLAAPFSFVVSIATKALAVCYLPMWIFIAYKHLKNNDDKIIIIGLVCMMTLTGLVLLYALSNTLTGTHIGFYPEHLWDGFARTIGILAISLPVLFVFLGLEHGFKKYTKPISGRNDSLIWLLGIIISTPIIYLFSGQFMFPYRFVPFTVFLSIYCSIVMYQVIESFMQLKKKV